MRLFATMTVFENVLVAAGTRQPGDGELLLGEHDVDGLTPAQRADLVLDVLDMRDLRDGAVTELSYGTRRKVEIARALVLHPRLLLLDEPAAGLNGAERRALASLLSGLRDRGLTIVLVEHQMDLVSAVCDELTVLDFGKVICDGPPERVIADERVLEAYLGQLEDGCETLADTRISTERLARGRAGGAILARSGASVEVRAAGERSLGLRPTETRGRCSSIWTSRCRTPAARMARLRLSSAKRTSC